MTRFRQASNDRRGDAINRGTSNDASRRLALRHFQAQPAQAVWCHRRDAARGLLTTAGISIWRLRSLGDLPDVGDPFDVPLARRPIVVPDEDNAFVSFTAVRR